MRGDPPHKLRRDTLRGGESKTHSRLHTSCSHSGGTPSTLQQTTKAESSAKANNKSCLHRKRTLTQDIHSDPKDQPSKRKTPESERYVKDQKGQKFTAEEGISLHKEKPPNQTISQHLPTIADCTGQLIEEVKEKKSDQKMIESPTVNANYTV